MPELPEVETICAGIAPHINQQRIKKVLLHTAKLRWPISKAVFQLENQIIISVMRRGKYILLNTAIGTAILHLGMSGYLQLLPAAAPKKKHDHIEIIFDNNLCLRLNDARRFGAFLWQKNGSEHPLLTNLGPEPLTPNFSVNYLFQSLKGKTRPIKLVIMDSSVVVGVGNIYANEALFVAQINPNRAAGTLSCVECKNLVNSIKKILKKAIKAGGTTLKDFQNSDGKPGYFKQSLQVYGREEKTCYACGELLSANRLGQRATVWCNRCQK